MKWGRCETESLQRLSNQASDHIQPPDSIIFHSSASETLSDKTTSSFEQTKRGFLIKSIMQTYRFVCNAAVSGCLPQLLVHIVGSIKSDPPLLWINSPSIYIISSCFPSSVSICTINKGSLSGRASLLIQLTLDTQSPSSIWETLSAFCCKPRHLREIGKIKWDHSRYITHIQFLEMLSISMSLD